MARDGFLTGCMLRLFLIAGTLRILWADPTELDSASDAGVSCLQRHATSRERPSAKEKADLHGHAVSGPRPGKVPPGGLWEPPELPGEELPDPCGREQNFTGFVRLGQPSRDPSKLFIDLTDVLRNGSANSSVTVLVTAMSLDGAYSDADGFDVTRAEPLEDTDNSLLVMRLSKNGKGIDFYRPSMNIRTSDNQSEEAVRESLGDGWLGSLERLRCRGNPDRIVISGQKLIMAGFFSASSMAGDAADYRILQARGYAKNFDVSVEYLMSDIAPLRVGYSLVLLPQVPMAKRPNDDRLLFFASEYQDLGYRQAAGGEAPTHEIDRHVGSIWRYRLKALPDRQIRIHVDFSVPERWREAFRQGIEAWNAAFAPLGHPRAVRGVVPGDQDWPQDYDMSDVRFSTISWDLSDEVVSMGIAKVDPRSGEIVKSDIIMSSGWVKAWLEDIESVAPGITHLVLPRGPVPKLGLKLLQTGQGQRQRAWRRLEQGHVSPRSHALQASKRSAALNSTALEELVASGLRAIVTHETGHILGLRHNFKGSLGISLDCLKEKSCTSTYGLSASVMDYVPPNIQSSDAASAMDVDVFNPVIGGYDKLAIAYGYRVVKEETWPYIAPELEDILSDAEKQFQACHDEDQDSEDPTCMAYDMSEDPISYFEQEFQRYVAVSKNLLEASVAPGEPLAMYGEAVTDLFGRVESLAEKVVSWVGGIKDDYIHRDRLGQLPGSSRTPISRSLQQRALALLLRVLRPKSSGLLPSEDDLPYLVEGSISHDHVSSVDTSRIIHEVTGRILDGLLDTRKLLQIHRQEHLAGAHGDVLSLDDVLRDLVGNILEPGLRVAGHGQDLPAQEMDLHFLLVRKLKNAYLHSIKNPKVDLHIRKRSEGYFDSKIVEVDPEEEPPELPEQISSKLLYYLQSARQLTQNTLERLPQDNKAASFWKSCGSIDTACGCNGLARLAVQGVVSSAIAFSPAIAVSGVLFCHNTTFPEVFVDGSSKMRDTTSWCECLSLDTAGPSDLRTHLALLHREFTEVFCEGGGSGCSEARVSLPLAPAPPPDVRSPFKASDSTPDGPGSRVTMRWFIIGISSALAIIFLSFVTYRLRHQGAIHD